MPALWGLLGARRDFWMIVTSEVAPTPESTREMAQAAAPPLTVGYTMWVVAGIVLLVGGQVGIRTRPSQSVGTRSTLGVLAAIGSVVIGAIAFLLFVGVWFHGSALETIIAESPVTPKPSELARHLVGVLHKSLLAFVAVGCQGVLEAVAAIFAPTSG
jgi:hypothetical protein